MNHLRQLSTMKSVVSHQSLEVLQAYADGRLPEPSRAQVDTHLQSCEQCGVTLRQLHRLDRVLDDLPEAPYVPFPQFWSRLHPRIAQKPQPRLRVSRPARLAAGVALAALASLVGVVALASDEVMPDNPLYPVKHLRQDMQLSLASPQARPRLELTLGKQRLHEAVVMVKRGHHDLALASLRDFRGLLLDSAVRLQQSPPAQSDSHAVAGALTDLEADLAAVRDANVAQDGADAEDVAAVDNAVREDQAAVDQAQTDVDNTIAPSPSPAPSASDTPAPSPEPSASDIPAQPSDSPPVDAATPAA